MVNSHEVGICEFEEDIDVANAERRQAGKEEFDVVGGRTSGCSSTGRPWRLVPRKISAELPWTKRESRPTTGSRNVAEKETGRLFRKRDASRRKLIERQTTCQLQSATLG